jgi:anthranilate synthase component 2
VCLGHQAIAEAFGGRVVPAPEIVHGKGAEVFHNGDGVMRGVSNPFVAGRYHSLVVERATLPLELRVTAWTSDGVVMGLRHEGAPLEGVQFHPESILTDDGKRLLGNFLEERPARSGVR